MPRPAPSPTGNLNCTCVGDGLVHTHVELTIHLRLPGDLDGDEILKVRQLGSGAAEKIGEAFGADPHATHFDVDVTEVEIHRGPRSYEPMR